VEQALIGLRSVHPEARPVGPLSQLMRLPLVLTVPPIEFPAQFVVRVRFPLICPLPLPPDSLLNCRLLPRCRIEQDWDRFPWAYHVPVRFSR
jgi:hypothetical protein